MYRPATALRIGLAGLLLVGCEKVPTFQELTSQQPQNAAQQGTSNPTTPAPKPPTAAPVVATPQPASVAPEVVIADLLKRPTNGINDSDIATLTNLPSGLDEIKSLDVTRSTVTDDGVRLISKLPALTQLDLTGTQIRGNGLAGLKGLSNLRVLTLNEIHSLTPECWDFLCELTQLETVNLVGTRITNKDVEKLTRLTSLKELNLSQTQVSDAAFTHLAEIENLQILRLEMNSLIDGSGLQAFSKSKTKPPLRELHSFRTKINIAGLKHVKGIPNLELLNIADILLTDQQVQDLKGTNNVKTLNVSFNRLTTASMPVFATMKNLEDLDLQNIDTINDACLAALSKVRGLRSLNVTRTTCSRKGLEAFSKLQKNCRLIFSDDISP